jgi:hypothetical protein
MEMEVEQVALVVQLPALVVAGVLLVRLLQHLPVQAVTALLALVAKVVVAVVLVAVLRVLAVLAVQAVNPAVAAVAAGRHLMGQTQVLAVLVATVLYVFTLGKEMT